MPTDFIQDSDGKVITGESTTQHIVDLAVMHKGWHPFFPFIGAGIEDNLDDELNLGTVNLEVAEEVRKDGGKLDFDYSDPDNIRWRGNYLSQSPPASSSSVTPPNTSGTLVPVLIKKNQSLVNFAIEHYGKLDCIFQLVKDNSQLQGITDNVYEGDTLYINTSFIAKRMIRTLPSEGVATITQDLRATGVGFEAIEIDLTVA